MLDGIVGSTVGALGSYLGVRSANKANRRLAGQQMDFQREMSNSAYQRSMDDMKKAGLNPILAYQQGGASVPAGATATMMDQITPALNSAQSMSRTKAELENLKESNANIRSQTILNSTLEKAAGADAMLKANSAKNVALNSELTAQSLPRAKYRAHMDSSELGKLGMGVERFIDVINPLKNLSR